MDLFSDERYMHEALLLARQAATQGEIPVGAVVVCKNRIIGKGSNLTEHLNDVTAHAEIMALTAASAYLGAKYLPDCTLYVTLEPCVMCAGALFWSQIGRVVYGAADDKRGFLRHQAGILHPKTRVTGGVMANECQALLLKFFGGLRT